MAKGILGKKLGMTQIFDDQGRAVPVTVIEAGPCPVVLVRTVERDGYEAVQLGFGEIKPSRLNKPQRGHLAKRNIPPVRTLKEFRWSGELPAEGDVIRVDIFQSGDRVHVTGISRGKGFAGVVKRWHSGRGPMSHGSKYHRRVGSMGASSFPSRVFKGKHMPGHMGNERVTVRNLEVVRADPERNLLLVKGAVPGARGSTVIIRAAADR